MNVGSLGFGGVLCFLRGKRTKCAERPQKSLRSFFRYVLKHFTQNPKNVLIIKGLTPGYRPRPDPDANPIYCVKAFNTGTSPPPPLPHAHAHADMRTHYTLAPHAPPPQHLGHSHTHLGAWQVHNVTFLHSTCPTYPFWATHARGGLSLRAVGDAEFGALVQLGFQVWKRSKKKGSRAPALPSLFEVLLYRRCLEDCVAVII